MADEGPSHARNHNGRAGEEEEEDVRLRIESVDDDDTKELEEEDWFPSVIKAWRE
eukprot:CAMPEP_0119136860 /NCGR_PEP_ID=MMETSP1310-20130426/22288_1 /TAXON_ID=464262 /ORGANISM="Genus nov. species nov., Strain RCC2339" /LENGTH=54 /DNA_ID=CAMNT_0007127895 /DNA_START=66 /DNA_END=227 /DNA_ORIENTATION=-